MWIGLLMTKIRFSPYIFFTDLFSQVSQYILLEACLIIYHIKLLIA